jgi:hypothetical protein
MTPNTRFPVRAKGRRVTQYHYLSRMAAIWIQSNGANAAERAEQLASEAEAEGNSESARLWRDLAAAVRLQQQDGKGNAGIDPNGGPRQKH